MRLAVELNMTRLVCFWNWEKFPPETHRPFVVSVMNQLKLMGFTEVFVPAWSAWPFYHLCTIEADMDLIPMLPHVSCTEQSLHTDPQNVKDKLMFYTAMLPTERIPAIWYNDDSGSLKPGDAMVLRALNDLGYKTVWTPPLRRLGFDAAPPLSTEIVGQCYPWPQTSNIDALWRGITEWQRLANHYPEHRRGVCLQTFGEVPEGMTLISLQIAEAFGASTAKCFTALSDQWPSCLFDWQKLAALTEPEVTEGCWSYMAHEVKEFTGGVS